MRRSSWRPHGDRVHASQARPKGAHDLGDANDKLCINAQVRGCIEASSRHCTCARAHLCTGALSRLECLDQYAEDDHHQGGG